MFLPPYIAWMNGRSGLLSRRSIILSGATLAAGAWASSATRSVGAAFVGDTPLDAPGPHSLNPKLLRQALAALDRHAGDISHRDRIGIVDFSASSSRSRFHLLDVGNGRVSSFLVAHGAGSDPEHTGFVQRFSNAFGSNASSEGAFVAGDYYVGKHGRSQRLVGLDDTNNNALGRALVIHGAWYANAEMLKTHGKLGRSQGCFAVGEGDLNKVFAQLGEGRLLYARKV